MKSRHAHHALLRTRSARYRDRERASGAPALPVLAAAGDKGERQGEPREEVASRPAHRLDRRLAPHRGGRPSHAALLLLLLLLLLLPPRPRSVMAHAHIGLSTAKGSTCPTHTSIRAEHSLEGA